MYLWEALYETTAEPDTEYLFFSFLYDDSSGTRLFEVYESRRDSLLRSADWIGDPLESDDVSEASLDEFHSEASLDALENYLANHEYSHLAYSGSVKKSECLYDA